jgi:hypothetical protein
MFSRCKKVTTYTCSIFMTMQPVILFITHFGSDYWLGWHFIRDSGSVSTKLELLMVVQVFGYCFQTQRCKRTLGCQSRPLACHLYFSFCWHMWRSPSSQVGANYWNVSSSFNTFVYKILLLLALLLLEFVYQVWIVSVADSQIRWWIDMTELQPTVHRFCVP